MTTLVVPSADTIGAFSPEVTAEQVQAGVYESAIAGALVTVATQTLADLTALSSSSGVAIVDAAGHFAGTDVETVTADLGARIHLKVADAAGLEAITAADRADGQIAVRADDDTLWTFDGGSAAGASDWVIVPTAGAGRWLRTMASLAELASTANGKGASLTGVEDAAGHFAGSTVEAVTADLGARVHLAVADDAAVQAITAADRADGQIAVKIDTYDPWIFDADSVVGADAWTIVPSAGAGRWIRPWLSRTDLATAGSATLGANLIGIRDAGTVYTATTVEGALQEVKLLADAALPPEKREVVIGHADLTDAVNGEAQAINVGAVLPANAVVLAHEVNVATLFSGGGATAVKLDVGGTSATAIVSQMDVFTGAATGALSPRTGAHAQGRFSAEQLVATFTPDAGHTLLALDAGSLTVTVWFTTLA